MPGILLDRNARLIISLSHKLFQNVFCSRQAATAGAAASSMMRSRAGGLLCYMLYFHEIGLDALVWFGPSIIISFAEYAEKMKDSNCSKVICTLKIFNPNHTVYGYENQYLFMLTALSSSKYAINTMKCSHFFK